jgi:6-pyruvoyltetrahydropterin/6-carboxytetrahydropterin synthase
MIIRKLFKFENAHIVRGCSTLRCRSSIHGHSYKVEVKFSSNFLDNGQMVYDFGLMKQNLKDLIEMFDHSITLWSKDDKEYISEMKKHSARWVELPVSPSAEQFARVIFILCDRLMNLTTTINGEKEVKVHSITVHETDTGYAEAFREDAYNSQMGEIKLEDIKISQAILDDFKDKKLWEKLLKKQNFINPTTI